MVAGIIFPSKPVGFSRRNTPPPTTPINNNDCTVFVDSPGRIKVGMKGVGNIDTGTTNLWSLVTLRLAARFNQLLLYFGNPAFVCFFFYTDSQKLSRNGIATMQIVGESVRTTGTGPRCFGRTGILPVRLRCPYRPGDRQSKFLSNDAVRFAHHILLFCWHSP